LPEAIREDLTDMFLWIGEESYYGLGSEKKQAESDKFLVKNADLLSWKEFVETNAPWNF
jgi:hypothetical protein